mgnify:CR=1 FL=1
MEYWNILFVMDFGESSRVTNLSVAIDQVEMKIERESKCGNFSSARFFDTQIL